jgi:bifunctional DNA-binding transcriptional regulator/antitoxin component of YhaV-PrlF toxin-antitoxin module
MPKQAALDNMLYGVATVGERNQIVIPKPAIDECGIKPKDRVLVFAHPQTNGFLVCKASALEQIVREMKTALRSVKNTPTAKQAKSPKRKETPK